MRRILGIMLLLMSMQASSAGHAAAPELKAADFHRFQPVIRSEGIDARFRPIVYGHATWLGQEIALHGYLHVPPGESRRRAIVYHGGCSGWNDVGPAYMADQIGWLVAAGYAVLHLDSFGSRGWTSSLCEALVVSPLYISSMHPARDAYLALEYLRSRPDIDAGSIAFMGYSHGGSIAFYAGLDFLKPQFYPQRFKAIVALKPGCPHLYKGPVITDMLAVYGGHDTSSSGPQNCRHFRGADGVDYRMLVLDGVYNSWLSVGMPQVAFRSNLPGAPASYSRFDPKARDHTKEQVLQWLAAKLR